MLEWFDNNVWAALGISLPLLIAGSFLLQMKGSLLGFVVFTGAGVILLTLGVVGAANGAYGELVEQGRVGMAEFVRYGMPITFFVVVCLGGTLYALGTLKRRA